MYNLPNTLNTIGHIIFGAYCLYSGFNHFYHFKNTVGYAQFKKVSMPKLATIITGIMLMLGGLSFIFNREIFIGIIILLFFFVPVTYYMHKFWKETDPNQKMIEKINFLKNMAIVGMLLMLMKV